MTHDEIYNKLNQKFGNAIIEFKKDEHYEPYVIINPESIVAIGLFLRDDNAMLFDYLVLLSSVDCGDKLGVVYHLYSTKYMHRFVLKVFVPKENPVVPTVELVWRTADWHEREAYDMMGVVFENHHNMIRILCPYDWEGYPLRKDYKTPEFYHDMKVPY
jgi:NADH-quinone oxidoreductase subunit C